MLLFLTVAISCFSPLPAQFQALGEQVRAKAKAKKAIKGLTRNPDLEPIYPGFYNKDDAKFTLQHPLLCEQSFDVKGAAVDKSLSVAAFSTDRESQISKEIQSGITYYIDEKTQKFYELSQVVADDGEVFIVSAKEVSPGTVLKGFEKHFNVESAKGKDYCTKDVSYLNLQAGIACGGTIGANWNNEANEPGVAFSPIEGINLLAGAKVTVAGSITVKLEDWRFAFNTQLTIDLDAGAGFVIEKNVKIDDISLLDKSILLFGIPQFSILTWKISAGIYFKTQIEIKDIGLNLPSDIKYIKGFSSHTVAKLTVATNSPIKGTIESDIAPRDDDMSWDEIAQSISGAELTLTPTVRLAIEPKVQIGLNNEISLEAGIEGQLPTSFVYDPNKCNQPALGGGVQFIANAYYSTPKIKLSDFADVQPKEVKKEIYKSPKVDKECFAGEKFPEKIYNEVVAPPTGDTKAKILEAKDTATITVNSKQHSLNKGDYFFIPSGTTYSTTSSSSIIEHPTFVLDGTKWTNTQKNKFLSVKIPVKNKIQYLMMASPVNGGPAYANFEALIGDGSSKLSLQWHSPKDGVQEIGIVTNIEEEVEVSFGTNYGTPTFNNELLTGSFLKIYENVQTVNMITQISIQQSLEAILEPHPDAMFALMIGVHNPKHDLKIAGDAVLLFTEDNGNTDIYLVKLYPAINVRMINGHLSLSIPFKRKGIEEKEYTVSLFRLYELNTNHDIYCRPYNEFYTNGDPNILMGCFGKMETTDPSKENHFSMIASNELKYKSTYTTFSESKKIILRVISYESKLGSPDKKVWKVSLNPSPMKIFEDTYLTEISEDEATKTAQQWKTTGSSSAPMTLYCNRASSLRVLKLKGEKVDSQIVEPNQKQADTFVINLEENAAYKIYPICKESDSVNCEYEFKTKSPYTILETSSALGLENSEGLLEDVPPLTAGTKRSLVINATSRYVFQREKEVAKQVELLVDEISAFVGTLQSTRTLAAEGKWTEVILYNNKNKDVIIPISLKKFYENRAAVFEAISNEKAPEDLSEVITVNEDGNIEIKENYVSQSKIENNYDFFLSLSNAVDGEISKPDGGGNDGDGGSGGNNNLIKIIVPVVVVVVVVVVVIVVVVIVIKKKKSDSSNSNSEKAVADSES